MNTAVRLLVLVIGAVAATVLAAAPAAAHASLRGASPAAGQRLDRPPAEVVLLFSERVTPVRDGVRLVDARARTVSREEATNPAGQPNRVRLAVPADLPDGTYTVSWRVVSADSHPVNGALVFTVGSGSSAAADPPAKAGTDADGAVVTALWLGRVGGYASLALLLGGIVFLTVCWPAGWSHRRARRVLWVGWAGGLATAVAGLLLQGPYAAGRSLGAAADPALLGETLRSDYGIFVGVRVVVLAALGAGLLLHPHRTVRIWLACLAAVLPLTWIGAGHANAGPVMQGAADAAHLAAMSAWVGGLVVLLVCLLPGDDAPEVGTAVPRFSLVATIAVAVLAGTGIMQAWLELGGLAALAGSGYGRLLFVKLAAVGLLLWLGAISRAVVRRRWAGPAPDRPNRAQRDANRAAVTRLRRTVTAEAAIVTVVLAITALLVATPPGTHGHATAAGLPQSDVYAGPVVRDLALPGVGRVQVRVEPARPGPNHITVSVRDAFGVLRDVPEVTARLRMPVGDLGPLEPTFDRLGPGTFRSNETTVPVSGSWRLEIAVRTTDFDHNRTVAELPII